MSKGYHWAPSWILKRWPQALRICWEMFYLRDPVVGVVGDGVVSGAAGKALPLGGAGLVLDVSAEGGDHKDDKCTKISL